MTERRQFIKTSLIGTAGLAIGGMGFSAKSYRSIIGSNDRINLCVIGIGGQGTLHIRKYASLKDNRNVRIKTLCDADEKFFDPKVKLTEELTGFRPGTEWDMRKVFEDKEIDAVSFAVPNHWHGLGTIWACQAGKNVYVEKPASYNVFEGRQMAAAARRYNVRVQTGCQNRSIPNVIAAMKLLHEGGIGDVYLARGLCFKPRDSFGIAPDSEAPATLHYDYWRGPAPMRPYNEKRVHYNWHWHWDTGNGDTGNQGPHQFDIARWGLNKSVHPVTVYSSGGLYGIDPRECSQETPNTQLSVFKYDDGKMLEFETRGRFTHAESKLDIRIGNLFYGTEGYLELNGSTWKAYKLREKEPFAISAAENSDVSADPTFRAAPGGTEHFANFLDGIRTGNSNDLTCEILEGHLSASLPHLANISYRLGRELHFDGNKEKFVNDREADKMLTRQYREPYVIPKLT